MLVTLLFFILGSLIATHHVDWWFALPSFPATSIVKSFGVIPALILSLAVFALIAFVTVRLEKRRHGQLEAAVQAETGNAVASTEESGSTPISARNLLMGS